MYVTSVGSCCGIGDIGDLPLDRITERDLEELIDDMEEEQSDRDYKILQTYIFGDRSTKSNGVRLAAYLKRKKIGTITEIGPFKNPRHDTTLKLWIWRLPKNSTGKSLRKLFGLQVKEDRSIYDSKLW